MTLTNIDPSGFVGTDPELQSDQLGKRAIDARTMRRKRDRMDVSLNAQPVQRGADIPVTFGTATPVRGPREIEWNS